MNKASKRLTDALAIVKNLEAKRLPHDERKQTIAKWILPHRGQWRGHDCVETLVESDKLILNHSASMSLKRAAAGMTSGMTPDGQPWFKLNFKNPAQGEITGAREWLDFIEQTIYSLLADGGFNQTIQFFNQELLGFGDALLFADSSRTSLLRFSTVTCGSFCVAVDEDGELDTVVHFMRRTPQQLAKKYGKEKLSERTVDRLRNNDYEPVEIVHIVRPREFYDPRKIDNQNMPYEAITFEYPTTENEVKDVLRVSGYHEMPYFFATWDRTSVDVVYGVGCGHSAVGLAQSLQEMERQKLILVQKLTSPPMRKPSSFKSRLRTAPDAENPVSSSDPNGIAPLYEVHPSAIAPVANEIALTEQRIASITLADLFHDLPADMRPADMTLGEYMQRKRERLQLLAPAMSSYEPNVLDKIISRCYSALERNGLIPPPPPEFGEVADIEVEYTSIVAQALNMSGVEALRGFTADVANLIRLEGEARHLGSKAVQKLNVDQSIDELAKGWGVSGRVVNSDEEVAAVREAEAQAAAQQQQQQAMMQSAEMASKVGAMNTGKDTLAGDLQGK